MIGVVVKFIASRFVFEVVNSADVIPPVAALTSLLIKGMNLFVTVSTDIVLKPTFDYHSLLR